MLLIALFPELTPLGFIVVQDLLLRLAYLSFPCHLTLLLCQAFPAKQKTSLSYDKDESLRGTTLLHRQFPYAGLIPTASSRQPRRSNARHAAQPTILQRNPLLPNSVRGSKMYSQPVPSCASHLPAAFCMGVKVATCSCQSLCCITCLCEILPYLPRFVNQVLRWGRGIFENTTSQIENTLSLFENMDNVLSDIPYFPPKIRTGSALAVPSQLQGFLSQNLRLPSLP